MMRLTLDSKEIHQKFGRLVSKTEKALETSRMRITADNLKSFLESSSYEKVAVKIRVSDTIPMAMRTITKSKCWSFFDYELLNSLITTYCDDEDVLMREYKQYVIDFTAYCTRRMYEVPTSAFPPVESGPRFAIKLDKDFDVPVSDIKMMELKLSRILRVELKLIKVKDGCIELTCKYFGVKRVIIGLNEEELNCLKELGVQRLHYDFRVLYDKEQSQKKDFIYKVCMPAYQLSVHVQNITVLCL